MKEIIKEAGYKQLLGIIEKTYSISRQKAFQIVNFELISTHWLIGKHIIEFEQKGKSKVW